MTNTPKTCNKDYFLHECKIELDERMKNAISCDKNQQLAYYCDRVNYRQSSYSDEINVESLKNDVINAGKLEINSKIQNFLICCQASEGFETNENLIDEECKKQIRKIIEDFFRNFETFFVETIFQIVKCRFGSCMQ